MRDDNFIHALRRDVSGVLQSFKINAWSVAAYNAIRFGRKWGFIDNAVIILDLYSRFSTVLTRKDMMDIYLVIEVHLHIDRLAST